MSSIFVSIKNLTGFSTERELTLHKMTETNKNIFNTVQLHIKSSTSRAFDVAHSSKFPFFYFIQSDPQKQLLYIILCHHIIFSRNYGHEQFEFSNKFSENDGSNMFNCWCIQMQISPIFRLKFCFFFIHQQYLYDDWLHGWCNLYLYII